MYLNIAFPPIQTMQLNNASPQILFANMGNGHVVNVSIGDIRKNAELMRKLSNNKQIAPN